MDAGAIEMKSTIANSPLKNVQSAKIFVETPGSKGVSTRCPRVFQRAATAVFVAVVTLISSAHGADPYADAAAAAAARAAARNAATEAGLRGLANALPDSAVAGVDPKSPKKLADADPELRKKLTAMIEDAKKLAREKMNAGVEEALAKNPKVSPEMAALLRSSSTHETWLKLVVDGALKRNEILLVPKICATLFPDELLNQHKTPLEIQYWRSSIAISKMREVDEYGAPTGREGDTFIEDYITKSINDAIAAATAKNPPATAATDKSGHKKRPQPAPNINGIDQLGGN